MADGTDKALRGAVLYQVFVRNHSKEGTFAAVEKDLDRIKALGADIIYLMPIHPIGEKNRKGTCGSPYAITDYRGIHPDLGTLSDFESLVKAIHEKGMRVIIDVVYNHTAPDSVLSKEHPEWFYHKPDGSFGNRVGDWSDIIDLDYGNEALWAYQIETLKYWAKYVDGFRCDVAPLVPLAFWEKARAEVEAVRPGCLWLAESIEPDFLRALRGEGLTALSDGEIFRAFDISYDYDIYKELTGYLTGQTPLSAYAEAVNRQEAIYPENFVKARFLENHDQARVRYLCPDVGKLRNLTAFLFFQKGLTFVFAGQEYGASHLPDLFEKDTVTLAPAQGVDFTPLFSTLSALKKDPLFSDSVYEVQAVGEDFLVAAHTKGARKAVGVFSMSGRTANVRVSLPDGIYEDKISGEKVEVFRGGVCSFGEPLILLQDEKSEE